MIFAPSIPRRAFLGRLAAAGGMVAVSAVIPRILAANTNVQRGRWRIGHHFWNWDHAWNKAEFFDRRLQLTKETGYAGFEVDAWYGIFTPAATPRALIAQLHKSIHAVVNRADIRDRYAAMGIEASAASQAEFAARVVRDSEKWRVVTKKLAIRVD